MTNRDEIRQEVDMLYGNINRMCVTKDEKELSSMRDYAKLRIDRIFECRQDMIYKGDV